MSRPALPLPLPNHVAPSQWRPYAVLCLCLPPCTSRFDRPECFMNLPWDPMHPTMTTTLSKLLGSSRITSYSCRCAKGQVPSHILCQNVCVVSGISAKAASCVQRAASFSFAKEYRVTEFIPKNDSGRFSILSYQDDSAFWARRFQPDVRCGIICCDRHVFTR